LATRLTYDVPRLVAEVERLRAELNAARVTILASVSQYDPLEDAIREHARKHGGVE
jgi:hypothetical protein